MSYPFLSKKYKLVSLVQAEDLIPYVLKDKKEVIQLPSRAILCFIPGLSTFLHKSQSRFLYKQIPSSLIGFNIDVYKKQDTSIAIASHFGIGAPAAVVCMEKLRVLGVKDFISIGIVGSLSSNLSVGSKVICVKSLRDEGCSYHYIKPSLFVEIEKNTERISKLIKSLKLKEVVSWTTDAPFRETKEELKKLTDLGVDCVEMESAALMSAAQYYKLSAYCLGVVSDQLLPNKWNPQFFNPRVRASLLEITRQVLFL